MGIQAHKKGGDYVVGGDVLGTVQETDVVEHKIMVPPNMEGALISLQAGSFTVEDVIGTLKNQKGETVELKLMQKWPVRVGRPYKEKLSPDVPLVTGQRVIDTLFPIAKGGVGTVPGPFGSGKNRRPASAGKMGGCGHRGIHRLRRTRQ